MSHKYLFKSERLGFRVWTKGDLHEFAEINADKDVMEHFPRPRQLKKPKNLLIDL